MPVYGTPFTLGLLHDKLDEHELLTKTKLHEFRPRQPWTVGPFTLEGIHVTHSIVDAVALAIGTPLGTILHTGDFKLDQTPIDNGQSDLTRLAELGAEGVLLLLADSTNVDRPGTTPSERTLTRPIEDIMSHAQGKVLVATFASHVHRIRQVIELSLKARPCDWCGREKLSREYRNRSRDGPYQIRVRRVVGCGKDCRSGSKDRDAY